MAEPNDTIENIMLTVELDNDVCYFFLLKWLDSTPENERTNESLIAFIEKAYPSEDTKEKEPTINLTAHQINQNGAWMRFCEWYGMNEWAMNEGQCQPEEEFRIPLSKAREWRLI